jgi:hypothetical protein
VSDKLSDAQSRLAVSLFNRAALMSNRITCLLEDAQMAPDEHASMALVIAAIMIAKVDGVPESAFVGMVHACWALAKPEAPHG